jgi:hypothetical protein
MLHRVVRRRPANRWLRPKQQAEHWQLGEEETRLGDVAVMGRDLMLRLKWGRPLVCQRLYEQDKDRHYWIGDVIRDPYSGVCRDVTAISWGWAHTEAWPWRRYWTERARKWLDSLKAKALL